MTVELVRRLFTAEEYHRMAQAGILGEDDRVELLEGEIIHMSPIGRPHFSTVNRLNALFTSRLGARAIVSVQNPVPLSDRSEPQPDLVLFRPRADFYAGRAPEISDVLLLVEVADSSLEFDRGFKLPLYARSGIIEVWILDLAARALEVYRGPGAGGYGRVERRTGEETASPLAFPDLAVTVREMVGAA